MNKLPLITRRQFLQFSSVSLVEVMLIGCNTLPQPQANPTVVVVSTTTSSADEVKELTFVIGSPPDQAHHQLVKLALTEAFKRLNIKFQLKYYPSNRATEMVTNGLADGEAGRIYEFAETGNYPNHVQVEAPYIETRMMGFAIKEGVNVDGLASLKGKGYQLGHLRGVKKLETLLPQAVDNTQIVAVDTVTQGLKMLVSDRIDIYFATADIYLLTQFPEFKDAGIKNVGLLYTTPLYPYLHKRHSALAPKLAETLQQMKTEGLMKQYEEQVHWRE